MQQKQKPILIVIGGGFAGMTIITQAYRNFNIILIDPKQYFEYVPSVHYSFINPELIFDYTIPYQQLCSKFNFKYLQAQIIQIQDHIVYYQKQDGEKGELQYDYCSISNGSIYTKPIKSMVSLRNQRYIEIKEIYERIRKSQTILVIGGGTVGVELACELKCHYLNKAIILASRNLILSTMPKRARKLALDRFKYLGLLCLENTDKSKLIQQQHDLIFDCTGNQYKCITIGDEFMKDDQKKQIQVNDYLEVRLMKNVFAAGDIAQSPLKESKTALSAEMYGELVVTNLKNKLCNKSKLQKLSWIPNAYIISLGGWQAILVFEDLSIGGIIAFLMKIIIEKIVINDFKGIIGFHLLHQIMNYCLYLMLHCFMFIKLLIALYPMGCKISKRKRKELKEIEQELMQYKQ